MAKRFTKSAINWIEFEKRVPPEQKTKFLAFKAKAEMYLRRVQANPPEPPKINWEEYQKKIHVDGLVEKLKTAYSGLQIPYPKDTLSVKVDEQWKDLEPKIKEYCVERQKDIDKLQKEVNKIKALPKFEDITMEMLYDLYPANALDPVNRPTFWPHTPEEQLGYTAPEQKTVKKGKAESMIDQCSGLQRQRQMLLSMAHKKGCILYLAPRSGSRDISQEAARGKL